MRMAKPRVNQVESGDGSAVLSYQGLDTSHDLGGETYLLRIRQGDRVAEIQARVAHSTSHAEQMAASEGVNYSALSLTEALAYLERVSDTYGRRLQIILFEPAAGSEVDIERDAALFCRLYFELASSYRYNNPEYPESGEGYYPDEAYFCPYDVDRRFFVTFRAGENADA